MSIVNITTPWTYTGVFPNKDFAQDYPYPPLEVAQAVVSLIRSQFFMFG